MVRIRCGSLYPTLDSVEVSVVESQRADEVVKRIVEQLQIGRPTDFELAEALLVDGQVCKERRLEGSEKPAKLQALWPKTPSGSSAGLTAYDFFIRRKEDSVKLGIWFDAKELHSTSAIVDSLLKPKQRDYADLCNLPDLNEKTMLSTLKKRFQDGQIYTYVGSILIAMNPFRFLPIYNPKHMKIYERCQLPDLPPHIFAIADSAYQSMLQTKTDQCIVISGESGSGKTESTNLLLHHLLHLSQKGSSEGGIEQVIAAAGPVLKAFGNAKTVHNDNSSRFGFFIQLSFKENGFVQKAVLEKYLLEKSRIVSQSRHERNYHIFYYLLAGLEETEKDSLLLTNPSAYHYLNQTDCFTISSGVNNECVDESQEFLRLVQSMDLVSFSVDVRKKIFAVLAAVLHLGNIEYTLNTENNFHDSVSIKNPETVKIVCDLLKVPETELVEALKQKKTRAGTETLRKSYKINDAVATRDSMAKCVYAALFDWIVLQINKALMSRTDLKIHHGNTIGLLDIFGFEDFDINSFEQFCINYANEHLHFYFNQHVFKLEQEEYRSEGIQWNDIDYIDNTECLHLFAKKPTGLLYLLDEECSFPGGTNESLLEKFNANHSNNAHFGVSVKKQKIFTICHYAGQVNYSIVDFREKNLDTMPQDLLTILKHSKLPLVRELVGYDMVALFRWSCLRAFFMAVRAFLDSGRRHKKMGSVKRKRSVPLDNRLATAVATSNDTLNVVHKPVFASKSMPVNGTQDVAATVAVSEAVEQANQIIEKSRLLRAKVKTDVRRRNDVAVMKSMVRKSLYASRQNKAISVGSQFNNSLQRLVDTLSRANPLFIRCIKSNNLKTPLEFDDNVVLRQLRYTGMLATINIRKSGYNYRLKFQDFIQQYCVILPRGMLSSRDDILALFQSLDINEQNYQLGKTKVFFREWEKLLLDQAMNAAIMNRVIKIQRFFKKSLNRLSFLQKKSAAVVLQSGVRMLLAKKRLHELRLQMYAAIRIQRMFRRYRMRRSIRQQQHTAATCIQSHYRGYQTRKNVALLRENSKKDIIDGHVESILNKTNVESFDGEYELETPLEVIEGSIDELKPKFSLYDDNDIFEYRPKDVYKIIRKPDNSCHSDSMISDTGRESSLADDERDDAFDGKITGRESSLADDERDDAFDEKTETEQVDDDVFNNKKSVEDSGYMKSFDEERFSLKIKLPVQNPPEEIPLRTISKSISDSYLMEMAAGLDAVRLTDKKVKAPIAIAETAEDEEEENIDLEIPLEVPADEDEDEQTSSQTSGKTRPNKGLQRSLPQLHEISGKQPHSKFVRKIKKIVTGRLSESDDNKDTLASPSGSITETSCVSLIKRGDDDGGKHEKSKQKKVGEKMRKKSMIDKTRDGRTSWKASEWQYPSVVLAESAMEMRQLEQFVYDKLQAIGEAKDSVFYDVFRQSLNEFCKNLVNDTSLALQGQPMKRVYKEAMANFIDVMKTRVKAKGIKAEDFDMTVGINGFRSILDEFCKKKAHNELPEVKEDKQNKQGKKDKSKLYALECNGHKYLKRQIYERAVCEFCSKPFDAIEKAYLCQICQYTVHKKCATKSDKLCKEMTQKSSRLFGIALCRMELSLNDRLPPVIERLITYIEQTGLYTEGLYRKIGAKVRINQIIKDLDTNPDSVDFKQCIIHDLSSVLKQYLRDLPIPIMTFDLYDEFMRAAEIADYKERVRIIYATVEKLPVIYFKALERIIFHLVRVAENESANRMSASNLAVVFGPCLLRCNHSLSAMDSLAHVQLQTACLECLINEQTKKLQNRLTEIRAIDSAAQATIFRLSLIRTSESPKVVAEMTSLPGITEEKYLQEQLESLQMEKESLTFQLPALEHGLSSSEEDLLSVSDRNQTFDGDESMASFDQPVIPNNELQHLNKKRPTTPTRRRPSRVKLHECNLLDTSIEESTTEAE